MNKYQRALDELYNGQGMKWREIAKLLGDAIGEKIYAASAWGLWKGKIKHSDKVERGLVAAGLVDPPRKRFRLAVEFESEEQRERYKEFYGINSQERTFTGHIFTTWIWDQVKGELHEAGNISTNRRDGL